MWMKRKPIFFAATLLIATTVLTGLNNQADALLIAVNNGGQIITPPPNVADDLPGATNDHQQGFNELQNVLLTSDLMVDAGLIPTGTIVNSHMIFLNTPGPDPLLHEDVNWLFDGRILGVMSDTNGNLEAASNPFLANPTTSYPGAFLRRGLELRDNYSFLNNSLRLSMGVAEPGDWVRVITAQPVPEPYSFLLTTCALGTLLLHRYRRSLPTTNHAPLSK